MHGRLKVRTTEEQQLIKQKEQQKKLLAYRHGMKVIHATRHDRPYNKESFAISASILERNPDVSTLWNYRKEVMLQQLEKLGDTTTQLENIAKSEEGKHYNTVSTTVFDTLKEGFASKTSSDCQEIDINTFINELLIDKNKQLPEDIKKLIEEINESIILLKQQETVEGNTNVFNYEHLIKISEWHLGKLMQYELDMTERCLLVNPKSYGAWHHRFWVLQHSPAANWEKELQLVEKYLRYDDRNFHTWDYRRLLLKKLGYEHEAELKFSTDRINTNFSNYSSWHYRSTLRELNAESLEEELRLVQNAVFTDPYDSSTWFYLRWVLSNKAVTAKHREALLSDFEQLLELEPNCKWIYMAKCWIAGSLSLSNKDEIRKKIDVYKKLMELDPARKGMYEDYVKLGEGGDS